jgi:hypothetical protein
VDTASEVMLNVAIRPEDFAPERLICLASHLKRTYRAAEIRAAIFSSYPAALYFIPLVSDNSKNAILWASQRHAEYNYEAEKHEEYLILIPDALSFAPNSPFNTRIDLPAAGNLRCKLEIRGRCLLEFEHIGASSDDGPAMVTLEAQIDRDGSVSNVHVVHAEVTPSIQQKALVDLALQNLKSWRFEYSLNNDEMKIAYTIEHVTTPLEHGVNVQFMLPDRVDIQIGPWLLSR